MEGIALRKRAQIAAANRMMFLWVAGASVIVGFALVGAIFLTQMLLFNQRVLTEKDKTIKVLVANKKAIPTLEEEIRKLDANQALIDSKARPEDQAIRVILDALPSTANSEALGASLQQKLLANVEGLTLVALKVDSVTSTTVATPVRATTTSSLKTTTTTASKTSSTVKKTVVTPPSQIGFTFSVSGSEEALKKLLHNLEISIRTIFIDSLSIQNQGDKRTLTVKAKAYYQPEIVVALKEVTVK